jgi:hypothetical protein
MSQDSQLILSHALQVPSNLQSDIKILYQHDDGSLIFRLDSLLIKLGPQGQQTANELKYQIKLMVDVDEDCNTSGSVPMPAQNPEFQIIAYSKSKLKTVSLNPDSAGLVTWNSSSLDTFLIDIPNRVKNIEYAICSSTDTIFPDIDTIQSFTFALASSLLRYESIHNSGYFLDSIPGISNPVTTAFTVSRNGSTPLKLRKKQTEVAYNLRCLPGTYRVKNDTLPLNPLSGWSITDTDTSLIFNTPNQVARIRTYSFSWQGVINFGYFFDSDLNCIRTPNDLLPNHLIRIESCTVTDLKTGLSFPHYSWFQPNLMSPLFEYEFKFKPTNTNMIMPCSGGSFKFAIPYGQEQVIDTTLLIDFDPASFFQDTVVICDTLLHSGPPYLGLPYFPWKPDTLSQSPLVVYMRHVQFAQPSPITYTIQTVSGSIVPMTDTLFLQSASGCDSIVVVEYISKLNDSWSLAEDIVVSPNPFNGYFSIYPIHEGELKLQLFGCAGNVLFEHNWNSESQLQIDINLHPGTYFLRLTQVASGHQITTRMICTD